MRYERFFKDPKHFIELANSIVPFLNGGLFDCLDDKDGGIYLDAFTDNESLSRQLVVPDYLFFGENENRSVDLSDFYGGDKNKGSVQSKY